MAKKYEKLAKTILDSIGGKENITYFQHCTTRLRFNLKDRSIVKISDIENVDQVNGPMMNCRSLLDPQLLMLMRKFVSLAISKEKKQLMKILMEMQKRKKSL